MHKLVGIVLGLTLLLGACADGGRVGRAACSPPNANDIMAWAKGVGSNVGHSRSARVANSNGYTTCHTEENASSSVGNPVAPSGWGFHVVPTYVDPNWHYDGYSRRGRY